MTLWCFNILLYFFFSMILAQVSLKLLSVSKNTWGICFTWSKMSGSYQWAIQWKWIIGAQPALISLPMFSLVCGTPVKEKWSTWLNGREQEKGEGAGSITWTQLLRLTTSIHHEHPPTATIPTPLFSWLSRQIGQTLCHPKEAPPCTKWKPERHTEQPPLCSSCPHCLLPLASLPLQPPLVGGEPVSSVEPREGWKDQTCQAANRSPATELLPQYQVWRRARACSGQWDDRPSGSQW